MTPGLSVEWRKSRRSGGEGGNCVEVAPDGRLRDSKNPDGPVLRVDLGAFLGAVKGGHI